MATPTRTTTIASTGRRLVGALSSAAAVALLGVTALTPQTAAAAGISTGLRYAVSQPSSTDPTASPDAADAVDVTHRRAGSRGVRV